MSLPSATKENPHVVAEQNDIRLIKEIVFVAGLIISLLFSIALLTYTATDSAWSIQSSNQQINNAVGVVGAWIADLCLSLFGIVAYLIPVLLLLFSWQFYRQKSFNIETIGTLGLKLIGLVLLMVSTASLAFLFFAGALDLPQNIGGILGSWFGSNAVKYGSNIGATLLLWLLFFTGSSIFANISWVKIADILGGIVLFPFRLFINQAQAIKEKTILRRAVKDKLARQAITIKQRAVLDNRDAIIVTPQITKIETSSRKHEEAQGSLFSDVKSDSNLAYSDNQHLPTLDLLTSAPAVKNGYSEAALQAMSRQVELKLKDFNVEVEVVGVQPGPVVTRFEFMPAPGIKASKITGLATDLARSLSQVSVRVVEVIPGKSVIGLEVPNEIREFVSLSEIIGSSVYEKSRSPLTLALGKDIAGSPIIADLAKMPHVLVAGTTGSGKSVCVNTMVLSLLYKATPADVRLIMIDPKMLELSVYEDVPHLLTPVVTDMSEAANALRWSVAEMERRYKLMSLLGVRNLSSYNKKVKDAINAGQPLFDPTTNEDDEAKPLEKLPYIVILIDEFADMIMVVGKKVEELIVRLAQKARAAGIHLVLATQRPSVDVITGLIKSNIPTRMAFQVSSKMDSRVVLDQMGAEQLLGKGDMLYLPPGKAFPERVHGAFVDDNEVFRVVEYLKQHYKTNYVAGILQPQSDGADNKSTNTEDDEYYDQAVKIVVDTGKASISGVQRQLRIGYNRSARLIEAMEAAGLVSGPNKNGMREVLVPRPD